MRHGAVVLWIAGSVMLLLHMSRFHTIFQSLTAEGFEETAHRGDTLKLSISHAGLIGGQPFTDSSGRNSGKVVPSTVCARLVAEWCLVGG